MTDKNLEDFLKPSDELQNELLLLAQKMLAKQPLTAAELALLDKVKAVRNELNSKLKP